MRTQAPEARRHRVQEHHPTVLSPTLQQDIRRLKRNSPWLLVLVAIAGVFGLVWWAAGLLIGPQAGWVAVLATPASAGLSPRTVAFPARDGLRLEAWWERAGTVNHPKGTVILIHGTDMNKSGMAYPGGILLARGYNVLIPDLRGHGASAGRYTTCGYMEALDVLGAIRWVRGRSEHGPVALVGYSSGAVAALYAAAQASEVVAVAADSAFDSVSRLLVREASYLGHPTPQMSVPLRDRLRLWLFTAPGIGGLSQRMYQARSGVPLEPPDKSVLDAVAKITRPSVLYLRAEHDPVVPPEVTQRLFERTASRDKHLLVFPGSAHSAMLGDPQRYIDTLEKFLDYATRNAAAPLAGNR
jgi:pimeloyl-ACP methyl ester carboxylesterase